MSAPSPLLGFNNNIRHKGAVFHVQTEDSGVKHPHIMTHLFADGGRILKSIKTSYANVLSDPQMVEIVRGMMKDQHKAMIVALRDGHFEPGGTREVQLPTEGPFATAVVVFSPPAKKAATPDDSGDYAPVSQRAVPQPNLPPLASPSLDKLVAIDEQTASSAARHLVVPPPLPSHQPIDVGALERAAARVANRDRDLRTPSVLPPPPANLLSHERPSGAYASVIPARPSEPRTDNQSSPPPRPSRPPSGNKYTMTRPASMFATSKPQGSVFGEDLLTERSLDEVILAYLAADLGSEKK